MKQEQLANIEKVSLEDEEEFYILSPLSLPLVFKKELFSILNKFKPYEMYQINIFVYLWTNDNRKVLLNIEGIYPTLDYCHKCETVLDNYATALSIFECYASIW